MQRLSRDRKLASAVRKDTVMCLCICIEAIKIEGSRGVHGRINKREHEDLSLFIVFQQSGIGLRANWPGSVSFLLSLSFLISFSAGPLRCCHKKPAGVLHSAVFCQDTCSIGFFICRAGFGKAYRHVEGGMLDGWNSHLYLQPCLSVWHPVVTAHYGERKSVCALIRQLSIKQTLPSRRARSVFP